MYALHPGSLPPTDPRGKVRTEVSAEDLVRLYTLKSWDYIVWDPTDGYDWFDFIHLYPSYYGRYTLRTDGTPDKDVPCGFSGLGVGRIGRSPGSPAAISSAGKTRKRS